MPRFNIGQLMLLTTLAALLVALGTTLYTRARGMFKPEAADYSPDGSSLAVRYTDGTVFVWNDQGRRTASIDTRDGWINFSLGDKRIHLLDNGQLLSANNAGRLQVWDIDTGQATPPFGPANMNFGEGSIAVSGDGKLVAASAIASAQPDVELWNVQTQQRIKRMPPELTSPAAIALSEDGTKLMALTRLSGVLVADVEAEEIVSGPHEFSQRSLSTNYLFDVSADLRAAALFEPGRYSQEHGGSPIELMDLETGQRADVYVDHDVLGIRLSPDATRLAVYGPSSEVTILDTQDGEVVSQIRPAFKVPAYDVGSLPTTDTPPIAFSPDGQEMIVASNVEVAVYDTATGNRKRRLWTSQESLSKWFFAPAFMVWGALWGIARRKQRQSDAQANSADVIDAELADADAQARLSPAGKPPQSLIVAWILFGVGGLLAILWSITLLFTEPSCLAFTPFPYYSLYAGVTIIAAGAGRRTDRLPLIYSVQMGNLICCDFVNFILGVTGLILTTRPAARNYAIRATRTHSA